MVKNNFATEVTFKQEDEAEAYLEISRASMMAGGNTGHF